MDDDEYGSGPGRSRLRAWLGPLADRPKDLVSLCLALAGAAAIVANALFLQTGPHPAPIFANPVRLAVVAESTNSVSPALPRPRPAEFDRPDTDAHTVPTTNAKQVAAAKPAAAPAAVPARRDAIAELLDPSVRPPANIPPNRLAGVQRALAEFGYGQIKPTGVADPETRAAIERFERERKLPVTGQLSERLVRELSTMKGSPL
jgi:hypothetical protein